MNFSCDTYRCRKWNYSVRTEPTSNRYRYFSHFYFAVFTDKITHCNCLETFLRCLTKEVCTKKDADEWFRWCNFTDYWTFAAVAGCINRWVKWSQTESASAQFTDVSAKRLCHWNFLGDDEAIDYGLCSKCRATRQSLSMIRDYLISLKWRREKNSEKKTNEKTQTTDNIFLFMEMFSFIFVMGSCYRLSASNTLQ